jgi:hypothetical protein
MRLFLFLFLILISSLAIAADTVYVSSLTNGSPPSLDVAKFSRTTLNGPLNFVSSISLSLSKAGGVTSVQPNGDAQLHVYRTEAVGSKARIVRETVDLTTFTFVAGSTKAFPANLTTLFNFDSNDALVFVQKQAGARLHTRALNAAGNLVGGFRPAPNFPAPPFGVHISDGKPFFISGLWIDPASGRTGITFANLKAPFTATSFLFSKRVLAQDNSVAFPRGASASAKQGEDGDDQDDDGIEDGEGDDNDVNAELDDDGDAAPASLSASASLSQFARRIHRTVTVTGGIRKTSFTPVGNPVRIGAARPVGNIAAVQYNGIGIDPLSIAIAYVRWNNACGSNEIILQTFNPVAFRKVGPPKFAKRCVKNLVRYGISLFNIKFKNGVTVD